jgi:hypothetical protein
MTFNTPFICGGVQMVFKPSFSRFAHFERSKLAPLKLKNSPASRDQTATNFTLHFTKRFYAKVAKMLTRRLKKTSFNFYTPPAFGGELHFSFDRIGRCCQSTSSVFSGLPGRDCLLGLFSSAASGVDQRYAVTDHLKEYIVSCPIKNL